MVSIKEYYNINRVLISPGFDKNSIDIIVQFENALKDEKFALTKVDSSSRVQFSDGDYNNNDDLYNKTPTFNAVNEKDNVPWDITTVKSCSKTTAKITLIGRKFGSTGGKRRGFFGFFGLSEGSHATQAEIPASNVFNKSYISLIVLNGNAIGEGKNYPEKFPTTIPPKC